MFSEFITEDKLNIVFHKSCVDGFFSVILLLEYLKILEKDNFKLNINLIPLTPNDINKRSDIVKQLEQKRKIILDLPFFGNNVSYYFDHHISNTEILNSIQFRGLFNPEAASTCVLISEYFGKSEIENFDLLVKIANIVDQAQFTTPPPDYGKNTFETFEDLTWASNDLIKSVRSDVELLKLFDSYNKYSLKEWFSFNEKYIHEYRKKRQKTLDLKNNIQYSPILVIQNKKFDIQAEGIHFSYSATHADYKMLVLLDKLYKNSESKKNLYKLTLRLNPKLNPLLIDKFRVDEIAKEFGGGGHKTAAGATIKNLELGQNKIHQWLETLDEEYFITQF